MKNTHTIEVTAVHLFTRFITKLYWYKTVSTQAYPLNCLSFKREESNLRIGDWTIQSAGPSWVLCTGRAQWIWAGLVLHQKEEDKEERDEKIQRRRETGGVKIVYELVTFSCMSLKRSHVLYQLHTHMYTHV